MRKGPSETENGTKERDDPYKRMISHKLTQHDRLFERICRLTKKSVSSCTILFYKSQEDENLFLNVYRFAENKN